MTRRPHAKAQAEKRIGRAAPVGDPWAAHIREQVLAQAHPPQRDAMVDPSRRISILTGRGGGKTTTYKGRFLIEMTAVANGRYIYACPTLGMAIELLWEPLKQACSALGLQPGIDVEWKEAPREGGKIMTIARTGSRLKLFGADDKKQINLCRGQPFNGVAGDEIAYWPSAEVVRNFVEKVVEPRIGERDGWIALASSPGHELRGLFYDVTRDASPLHRAYALRNEEQYAGWTPEQWSSHAWSLRDIVKLPDAEENYPSLVALRRSHLKIKAAKGWSDDHPVWMREYEGRWSADDTTMVFRFNPEKNLWRPHGNRAIEGLPGLKIALAALPNGMEWHHVLVVDKGSPRAAKADETGEKKRDGDPWAVNVLSFSPADPKQCIKHTYFLEKTGLYARPLAQLCLGADEKAPNGCMSHDKPGGIFGLIGWPDAMVADADESTIADLANVYGLRFEKPQKRPEYKAGAIELTNGDLVDGRIEVIEDSPMHRQLTGLQWAEQDSGALKEDPSQPNHSTDTLIYGREKIAALFESGVVNREESAERRNTTTYDDPMGLDDDAEAFDLLPMEAFDDLTDFGGRF